MFTFAELYKNAHVNAKPQLYKILFSMMRKTHFYHKHTQTDQYSLNYATL